MWLQTHGLNVYRNALALELESVVDSENVCMVEKATVHAKEKIMMRNLVTIRFADQSALQDLIIQASVSSSFNCRFIEQYSFMKNSCHFKNIII